MWTRVPWPIQALLAGAGASLLLGIWAMNRMVVLRD